MRRSLGVDSHTGIEQIYHGNNDGTFTIQTHQDVSQYLRQNAQDRSSANSGWKGDMHQVASIPPIVWHMWWKELGDDPGARRNRKWLAGKLNSSEFLRLRVKEGRM